jgi:indolepyruvate ferredoxin oxidoreductase beta subunit
MIVGVGGQGTLLASKILGKVLTDGGFDVKVSEVHGMSQRGGSVVTYVRWCPPEEAVASPLIDKGEADYILSFEELEAARWLPYLKQGGKVITNTRQLNPMPVVTGAAVYPQGCTQAVEAACGKVKAVDALALAQEAGSQRAVNVVLLGTLARELPFSSAAWEAAITACVKPAFADMNKRAFAVGLAA